MSFDPFADFVAASRDSMSNRDSSSATDFGPFEPQRLSVAPQVDDGEGRFDDFQAVPSAQPLGVQRTTMSEAVAGIGAQPLGASGDQCTASSDTVAGIAAQPPEGATSLPAEGAVVGDADFEAFDGAGPLKLLNDVTTRSGTAPNIFKGNAPGSVHQAGIARSHSANSQNLSTNAENVTVRNDQHDATPPVAHRADADGADATKPLSDDGIFDDFQPSQTEVSTPRRRDAARAADDTAPDTEAPLAKIRKIPDQVGTSIDMMQNSLPSVLLRPALEQLPANWLVHLLWPSATSRATTRRQPDGRANASTESMGRRSGDTAAMGIKRHGTGSLPIRPFIDKPRLAGSVALRDLFATPIDSVLFEHFGGPQPWMGATK